MYFGSDQIVEGPNFVTELKALATLRAPDAFDHG